MPIPTPHNNESHDDFISRCMADPKMNSEYDDESQRFAICSNQLNLAGLKISFDFDDTISTKKGQELAKRLHDEGNTIYIISARGEVSEDMKRIASEVGVSESRIYATGSNKAKVDKIKELGIDEHYDNNPDVVRSLPNIGNLFS